MTPTDTAHATTPTSPPPPTSAPPVLDAASLTALRVPAVQRLLTLRAQHRLTRGHVRLAAQCLDVSERTMWRRLADASHSPEAAAAPGARRGARFEVTSQLRVLLAYRHGNVSAVHRELTARARAHTTRPPTTTTPDGAPTPPIPIDTPTSEPPPSALPGGAPVSAVPLPDPVPSLPTLLRAVRRDPTPGERAGLRAGPEAARALAVFARRPPTWRNHTWEADHVQAPLTVDAEGTPVRPHISLLFNPFFGVWSLCCGGWVECRTRRF